MIGPGGVGKTSLLNGLKDKPLPPANSTQLAETSTVKPQKWSRAIEDPESPWTDVTEDDEIDEIVGLVQLVKNVKSGESRSSRFYQMAKAAADVAFQRIMHHRGTGTDCQNEVMRAVDEILSRAVKVGLKNPGAQAPESEVMLHVWDCGGQPVFLDVLPPFLTSRTMFMLMFDASKNLHEKCVAESHQNGAVVRSEQYHDTTTMELLLQWMATIHATLSKQGTARKHVPRFPRILPIGTHGDMPSVKSHKEEILREIRLQCENKAFAYLLRPGVIVDNTKAGRGDSEDPAFKEVRKQAYKFANEDLKIPTPITWVLFRKIFKKLAASKPMFHVDEVKEIATACGIKEGTVQSVLKFYHDLAVFFHYAHIPSLKEYVIADVQWLINLLAKVLALEGFEENKSSLLWKPLREKGILIQPLCEEVWKSCGLPPKALLDLMESFLLLTPIHPGSEVYPQYPGKEYFIPSVLKPFNAERDTVTPSKAVKRSAPLHLRFSTQYVPPGFFSRLVTLLAKEQKCCVLFEQEVYRNRISLFYGEPKKEIDKVTISQLPSSIEIVVTREQPRLSHHPLFSTTCYAILKLIQECSVSVCVWLPEIKVSLAFLCEEKSSSDGKSHCSHFIEFEPVDTTTCSHLKCEKFHNNVPTQGQQYWCKVSSTEEDLCDTPLSLAELDVFVTQVPQEKIKELAKCLEMTKHLVSEDHTCLQKVLRRWFKEMQKMKVENIRSFLVHHLRIAGLEELAEMLKYGEIHEDMTELSSKIANEGLELALTEEDLRVCSRSMDETADLSLLANKLGISDDEMKSIRSRHKKHQGQAHNILQTWHSRTQSPNKRHDLVVALNTSNHSVAADRLAVKKLRPKLPDLLKHAKPVATKWHQLGVQLRVSSDELAIIDHDNQGSVNKLSQMFEAWLAMEINPTWYIVADALDNIDQNALANQIRQTFC